MNSWKSSFSPSLRTTLAGSMPRKRGCCPGRLSTDRPKLCQGSGASTGRRRSGSKGSKSDCVIRTGSSKSSSAPKGGTAQVASEYASRDSRVRLVRQQNRGLAGARNRGLGESVGEYVVFLDSDDRLLEEALEVGVRELASHLECAFVAGHYRPIGADGEVYGVPRQARVEGDHYLALLRDNYISMPASVMYRRWVFEEVGGFDGSVDAAADWDLYLRVARRFPIHHHGEVVADYRWHGSNMTNDPALMLRSTVSVLRRQRQHVKGNKRYEQALEEGIKLFREHNGVNLAKEIRSHVRRRDTGRALRGALVLARFYPQGLGFLMGEGRLKRYELAEQLEAREKRLKNRERKLRVANNRVKELNGAVAKEQRRGNWPGKREREIALGKQSPD